MAFFSKLVFSGRIQLYLHRQAKKRQKWYYIIIVCYLLYFGIYAHQRTKVWYDSDTLKNEVKELLQQRNMPEEAPDKSDKEKF